METFYYKISYANGHTKYIKSQSDHCEIILITPFDKRHQSYKSPYPIMDENDYEASSEIEFNQALKNLGVYDHSSVKELGTAATIGELKNIIRHYPDETSFGFRNQHMLSLFEIKSSHNYMIDFRIKT